MRRKKIVLLIVFILAFCGCDSTDDVGVNSGNSSDRDALPDTSVLEGSGEEVAPEIPIYEYSDEEKALLSMDMEKALFMYRGFESRYIGNGLELTKNQYPDITFINSTEKIVHVDKEEMWQEFWHSESTGLSYEFFCVRELEATEIDSGLTKICGQVDNLIAGIVAPIEANKLMNLIATPEIEWAIGEAPDVENNIEYYPLHFDEIGANDVCIVVATPYTEGRHIAENFLIGIKITTTIPGFVSAEDVLVIKEVVWRD